MEKCFIWNSHNLTACSIHWLPFHGHYKLDCCDLKNQFKKPRTNAALQAKLWFFPAQNWSIQLIRQRSLLAKALKYWDWFYFTKNVNHASLIQDRSSVCIKANKVRKRMHSRQWMHCWLNNQQCQHNGLVDNDRSDTFLSACIRPSLHRDDPITHIPFQLSLTIPPPGLTH